jgi:hypothetical protein
VDKQAWDDSGLHYIPILQSFQVMSIPSAIFTVWTDDSTLNSTSIVVRANDAWGTPIACSERTDLNNGLYTYSSGAPVGIVIQYYLFVNDVPVNRNNRPFDNFYD